MPLPGSPLPARTVYALAIAAAPRTLQRFRATTPTVMARVVTAIAKQESNFHPLANNGWTGANEAIGLMQILPATQATIEDWLGLPHHRELLYQPDYALLLGATYLAYQKLRYGSWERAVYSYYAGSYPGATRHQAGAQTYARSFFTNYRKLFGSDPRTNEQQGVTDEAATFILGSSTEPATAFVAGGAMVVAGWWFYRVFRPGTHRTKGKHSRAWSRTR